jgi:hypothetical protein
MIPIATSLGLRDDCERSPAPALNHLHLGAYGVRTLIQNLQYASSHLSDFSGILTKGAAVTLGRQWSADVQ